MVRGLVGTRVARREDRHLLTRGGTYVADLKDPLLDGALHAVFLRSTAAHARVRVDVARASSAPGVVGAFTADDLGIVPRPSPINQKFTTQWLATDVVRWVGQPVAVVVATDVASATDALEQIDVEYETLPVVVDSEAAIGDEVLLYPAAGTNVCSEATNGNVAFESDDIFAGCDIVVEGRLVNQRLAACPLEVRGAAAAWTGDGRLAFWTSSQLPHTVKMVLEMAYGASVRVVVPDMGGAFGPKSGLYSEGLLLPMLARRVGRPIRWLETRTESMANLEHGRGQLHRLAIGGTRDGRVLAYRLDVVQDVGAVVAPAAVLACVLTIPMAPGPYDIARVACRARGVLTNTTPVGGYRGAGRPEATAAIERAMDMFAAAVEMDPAEVRRRNLLPAFGGPRRTPTGLLYDSGAYHRTLELALAAADYDTARKEQQCRRDTDSPVQLGIGVATYVEITGKSLDANAPREYARIEVHSNDDVIVAVGTSPNGQGHQTTFSMIAADELGIPESSIAVRLADTDVVPEGNGTFGSRSLQQGGHAVQVVAREVVELGRLRAAELLEASDADVEFHRVTGRFQVRGTPRISVGWSEITAQSPLVLGKIVEAQGATFPFGAHVAVVEVDIHTGRVELLRHIACDDAGTIVNPLIFEGQVHGGIAAGVAQALYEEVRYDRHGTLLTSNFADYGIPSAAELPAFELVVSETPTPFNGLGAKGVGESGTIGATPAVQSAVIDALSPFGITHIDLPLTAERVWRAITDAQAAEGRVTAQVAGELHREAASS